MQSCRLIESISQSTQLTDSFIFRIWSWVTFNHHQYWKVHFTGNEKPKYSKLKRTAISKVFHSYTFSFGCQYVTHATEPRNMVMWMHGEKYLTMLKIRKSGSMRSKWSKMLNLALIINNSQIIFNQKATTYLFLIQLAPKYPLLQDPLFQKSLVFWGLVLKKTGITE